MSEAHTHTACRVQFRDPDTGLMTDYKENGLVVIFPNRAAAELFVKKRRQTGDLTRYSYYPAYGTLSSG